MAVEVPTLETERLILRGHRVTDFEASLEMWSEPSVVAHITGVPSTPEQTWARLLRYIGHWQALGYGYWVIESKAEGVFVGEAGLADYQRDTTPSVRGKPEAGWALIPSAQGKGLATEAVAAVLRWADDNLAQEFSAASAIFDPANQASMRVAEKVGFGAPVMGTYGEVESLFMERPLGKSA